MAEVTFFWDKNKDTDAIRMILRDENHARFAEFAALLLSRTNEPKVVFADYLDKQTFLRNWPAIKRRMRRNKWNDARIIFWGEVARVLMKQPGFKRVRVANERPLETDPDIRALCERIRHYRKQAGLTQIGLAGKSGLSQQAISFVEKGYVNISLRTLKKIADALSIGIELREKRPGHEKK